jgi:hypothetical protein
MAGRKRRAHWLKLGANLGAKLRNRGKKRALKMYYWVALGRNCYALTN